MLLKLALVVCMTAFQTVDVDTPEDNLSVSERYTLRITKPRGGMASVKRMAVSQDGKKLAMATYDNLVFARCSDGEIEARFDSSPFALTFSGDGERLLAIEERKQQMFQTSPPSEIPFNFSRPNGYLGINLVQKNGKIVVASVDSGSPAAKSDLLKPGAELIAIKGDSGEFARDSVVGKPVQAVLQRLEGPANTDVKLTVIPRGQIEDTAVTLTRLAMLPTGKYGLPKKLAEPVPVASCVSNEFHEFRSAETGDYVSSIKCEQIRNDRGAKVTSRDGKWFAFVSTRNSCPTHNLRRPILLPRHPPPLLLPPPRGRSHRPNRNSNHSRHRSPSQGSRTAFQGRSQITSENQTD